MKLINATYSEMLQRAEWKAKRALILERDGHVCKNCGTRFGLQVHHKQYHRFKPTGHKLAPWCYAEKYLITLCDNCHHDGHQAYQVPRFTI